MMFKRFDYKNIFLLLALFLGIELISFVGLFYPVFLKAAFLLIILIIIFLSFYRPKYALLLIFLELIVGSKGYLLFWPISDSVMLSLRIAIWSVFMLSFTLQLLWQLKRFKKESKYWQNIINFPLLKPYLILAVTLLIGLISSFLYQNNFSHIFHDFNNWLYFLLLFPVIALRPTKKELGFVLFFGAIWLSLKTLILLGIFSNDILSFPFYAWLRKTLVGEMTTLDGWNRIFIQSQSFVAIAYLFILSHAHTLSLKIKKANYSSWLIIFSGALFFSSIVLSLSRSFWLGLIFATFFLLFFLVRKLGFKRMKKPFLYILFSIIIGILLILAVIPKNSKSELDNQIASRISSKEEAAVGSRWALLPPLFEQIMVNPITGQGFGANVTYISQDPRVLENEPSGIYTTYAFEWGYLDIWLKTGIIGLIAYLWLLFLLIKKSLILAKTENNFYYYGLASAIVFLAVVHFFTPYLNHPLGIGFIVASSCLIYKNEVY